MAADACERLAGLGTSCILGLKQNGHDKEKAMSGQCCRVLLAAIATAELTLGSDWPAYKRDAQRSGVATASLSFPLREVWRCEPSQAPAPAWPEPGRELHRLDFDYAFQPVVANGLVYFGSSADDTVRAIDAATGKLAWRFTAAGPIRFAPAIARGRAYVASDDGWLYCLDAKDGQLVWRFRGAPSDDQIIGNGRMISRWPLRSGVLVADDVVYLTAGMWPTQGVYVYALDAATGKEIWCNDTSGSMYLELPHCYASGFSGVSPQGYLLASKDILLVPTGRSVPAGLDRRTGRLLYYEAGKLTYKDGGGWATIVDDLYFTPQGIREVYTCAQAGELQPRPGDGMLAHSLATGESKRGFAGKYRVLGADDMLYTVGRGTLEAVGLKGGGSKWRVPHTPRVYCMALADQRLLLGGPDSIAAIDVTNGKAVWRAETDGQVRGMAIADERLVAATHRGALLCFGRTDAAAPHVIKESARVDGLGPHEAKARRILELTGVTEGYALVVGEPNGGLALALAMQSKLRVLGVMSGTDGLADERGRLLATGLYGSRVVVHGADDLSRLPYAPYFADLVVVSDDAAVASGKELYRVLRPCGGVLCFADAGMAKQMIVQAGIPKQEIREDGMAVVRGPLPGAGEWRYPLADPGRTSVGKESRLRLPFDVLWFGGPGPARMMDRHIKTSPPLSVAGRVFVTGEDHLIAFDAYNGRELWCREEPGVGRKFASYYGPNSVADDDSWFVAKGDRCLRLDQATGKTQSVYRIPQELVETADEPSTTADVTWPTRWHVVGPFADGSPPLPPDALRSIPRQVTVDGKHYAATELRPLDLTSAYGVAGGRIAYAFAELNCPAWGRLLIEARDDRRMQWHFDGEPIRAMRYSMVYPFPHVRDTVAVDVTPGRHVVALKVSADGEGWPAIVMRGAEYAPIPPDVNDMAWGYVSVMDDLLLGSHIGRQAGRDLYWASRSIRQDAYRQAPCESRAVFALKKDDGSTKWTYRARQAIANNSIVFDEGRLFLLDATSLAEIDRAKRRRKKIEVKQSLVALSLVDGQELWRTDDVPRGELQYSSGMVLVAGKTAYSATTGELLRRFEVGGARPIIHGDWAITCPGKYGWAGIGYNLRTGKQRTAADILTGEQLPWRYSRTCGCGPAAGCQSMLYLRSGAFGFYDLQTGGMANFGAGKPSCSLSMVAANGLMIIPEGSAGCGCSYSFQASLALVPSDRQDYWYVFTGLADTGRVEHLRLNFGAPGDRRDSDGNAWIGYPRPFMRYACEAPVAVLMREPSYYKRSPDRLRIATTDRPWIYTSGLRGQGKIAVRLDLQRSVVAGPCATPPIIDGQLDDPCWQDAPLARFAGDAHLLEPKTFLHICRDEANVYFSYRRLAAVRDGEPAPFVATQTGDDADCRKDDTFEIFFSNKKPLSGLYLGVSCGGGRFDALSRVYRQWPASRGWNGEWRSAVHRGPSEWTAEVALPVETLKRAKVNVNDLRINCMSQNLSGRGLKRIYLTDPILDFGCCQRFLPLVNKPAPTPSPRTFTVRLHFAEIHGLAPGQCAFDVLLQGKPALRGLDVAKETGSSHAALVKEWQHIPASDQLTIELRSQDGEPPAISGVEILAEE